MSGVRAASMLRGCRWPVRFGSAAFLSPATSMSTDTPAGDLFLMTLLAQVFLISVQAVPTEARRINADPAGIRTGVSARGRRYAKSSGLADFGRQTYSGHAGKLGHGRRSAVSPMDS